MKVDFGDGPLPVLKHNIHLVTVTPNDTGDGVYHYEVEHPDTCVRVERYQGDHHLETAYECGFQYEVDNVGWDDTMGVEKPGKYAARHQVETHRGPDFTEYSTYVEVIPLP